MEPTLQNLCWLNCVENEFFVLSMLGIEPTEGMFTFLLLSKNLLLPGRSGVYQSFTRPSLLTNALTLVRVLTQLRDIAMKIVEDYPHLVSTKSILQNTLTILARKTSVFSGAKEPFISRIIKQFFALVGRCNTDSEALQFLKVLLNKISVLPSEDVYEIMKGPPSESKIEGDTEQEYSFRVLLVAAEMGNTRFLIEVIRLFPDLMWKEDDKGRNIFHIAVNYRHERVYNQNFPGDALLMQRELLWYKEIEQMIPPWQREMKNREDKTAYQLLIEKHKRNAADDEKWLKETASRCTVCTLLIYGIVFAATFRVADEPPNFALTIFAISSRISLTSSLIAISIFVSILMSMYTVHAFLESLPKMLRLGLATFMVSIIAMMVSFSSGLFILHHEHIDGLPIILTASLAIPFFVFFKLHVPVLIDVFSSTCR